MLPLYIELTEVNCSHEKLCFLIVFRELRINGLYATYVHKVDCKYIELSRKYLPLYEGVFVLAYCKVRLCRHGMMGLWVRFIHIHAWLLCYASVHHKRTAFHVWIQRNIVPVVIALS